MITHPAIRLPKLATKDAQRTGADLGRRFTTGRDALQQCAALRQRRLDPWSGTSGSRFPKAGILRIMCHEDGKERGVSTDLTLSFTALAELMSFTLRETALEAQKD
jgi:hypothetical protein